MDANLKIGKKDRDHIAQLMESASDISSALLHAISRNYLHAPTAFNNYFEVSAYHSPLGFPHFVRIGQIGRSLNHDSYKPLSAMQMALASCHSNSDQEFVFLVIHNQLSNDIYMGVRDYNALPYSFMRSFRSFLGGLYPGSSFENYFPNDPKYENRILAPLREMKHGICLTGIPSIKQVFSSEHISHLDKLLSGIQGKSFAYFVVASPLSSLKIEPAMMNCRRLIDKFHALGRINLSQGLSETSSNQKGSQESRSMQRGSITDKNNNLIKRIANEIYLLGAFIKDGSVSESETNSIMKSISESHSVSESLQYGSEFINSQAQAVEYALKKHLNRFYTQQTSGTWNVGVYCLSEYSDTCKIAGMQIQSILNGPQSTLERVRWHDLERFMPQSEILDSLHRLEIPPINQKDKLRHPFGHLFNSLTTPLSTDELSLLVSFPEKELPGVRFVPTADFSLNNNCEDKESILLGKLSASGRETEIPYRIDHSSFCKHIFVTGITGSGKSTTCRKILSELDNSCIPFLVIEPAKEEYVEWAFSYNEKLPIDSPKRINIFIPGLSKWKGHELNHELKLNPLDVIWLDKNLSPPILTHIDRLKSIINASFPMQEVLPLLLEEILYSVYSTPNNWLEDNLSLFANPRPTLIDLAKQIPSVIKGKGYSDQIAVNLVAALATRLKSLCRGWKRQLFTSGISTSWPQIFDHPTVINLSYLGDDADKAFTMAIILLFLYEYRQAQDSMSQESDSSLLKHVTLIEEAHRLLTKVSDGPFEQMNPKKKVADMFSNIISEIRSYGEGLIIAEQIPARITPDVVKNTNLKIVHRLVAADDRESMSSCMTLSSDQSKIINHLRPGEAIIYGEQDDTASWVRVVR